MEDLPLNNYRLSRVIEAHANDVKSIVAVNETGAVISGGRDERVKLFAEKDGEFEKFIEINNNVVVNSVEVFNCPDGSILIFCGRKDGSIGVYNAECPEPQFTLNEHSLNVCVLKINQASGQLISGSWDSRAVIFDINDLIFNRPSKKFALEGHRNSIWGVEFVPNSQNRFLTASADKTIRLWEGNTSIHTFSGHNDVVRCLVTLSEERFVSASNDSTIRLWNMTTGKCEQVHESSSEEFIYSMTMIQKNDKRLIASCGEGGHIEIFVVEFDSTLTDLQIIRAPATSLWSARFLPNTDLAIAASNGYIYIFSGEEERFAPSSIQEVFDSSVAAKVAMEAEMKAAQDNDTVTIKVSLDDGVPNLELKYVKGSNPVDAAENFIRENNLPYSYLNEITDYIKMNVPEAQNYNSYKPSKATNIQQQGKADYNFDITIEGGKKLTLGYNVGDDPDFTVQKFCEVNNLPIKFVGQLSTLIRAQVPELQGMSGQAYSDPFTGQGRHVPSTPSTNNSSFRGDPLTGGESYIPAAHSTSNGNSGGGDPFTSGGRYIPGQESANAFIPNSLAPLDKLRPRSDLVPVRHFYTFGNEGASVKAQEALKNANASVESDLTLEEPLIESLLEILGGQFVASEIQLIALEKALQWPLEFIVPALDAFRLAILDPTINEYFCSVQGENHGAKTLERLSAILISEPTIPVRILICRALANATKHQPGRDMISLNFSQLSEIITRQITFSGSKVALQLAASSFLANIALILLRKTEKGVCAELGPREDVLRSIIKCTENINSFGDCSEHALQRLLQAIVTLMWGDSTIIDMAKSRGIEAIVIRIKDAVKTDESKNISRDIYAMTNA